MGAQLNIFDSVQSNLSLLLKQKQEQLQKLNYSLGSTQKELNTYDPNDYEDRNDINACNQQIRYCKQQIDELNLEIADLEQQILNNQRLSNQLKMYQQRQM